MRQVNSHVGIKTDRICSSKRWHKPFYYGFKSGARTYLSLSACTHPLSLHASSMTGLAYNSPLSSAESPPPSSPIRCDDSAYSVGRNEKCLTILLRTLNAQLYHQCMCIRFTLVWFSENNQCHTPTLPTARRVGIITVGDMAQGLIVVPVEYSNISRRDIELTKYSSQGGLVESYFNVTTLTTVVGV